MRASIALVVVLATTVAHAEPAEVEHVEKKDTATALVLSLGGTAAAVSMFAVGYRTDQPALLAGGAITALAAPSFGHIYAGEYVTPGTIVRFCGAGLALAGLVAAMSHWDSPGGTPDYAGVLAITGGSLFAAGSLYDIVTAPKAVRRYNEKHAISLSPSVVSSGGPAGVGLSIGGSF